MNLYKINPEADFLITLADFIVHNFNLRSNNLKVILPSGIACTNLQKILIGKAGTSFLPTTVSFFDIMAEGEEIFKIPSEDVERISYLEQKIILAKIIEDFENLNMSFLQSLKFVSPLTNLFQEIICNSIPIEEIKNLSLVNHAEHWHTIYGFLNYAYERWQKKLCELKKADRSVYQISMLNAEAERLENDSDSFIIVAGIFGNNKISWNFLKNIAKSSRGFIILPPLPNFSDETLKNFATESTDVLYCLNQLLNNLNKNLSDFKPLAHQVQLSQFDDLLISSNISLSQTKSEHKIEYYEFENIFEEAEAISLICKNYDAKKIAIVVNNEKSKEFYVNFLLKNVVRFQDNSGVNLSKLNVSQLILNIGEIIYNEFDLTRLLILLKNPLINCVNVLKLEKILTNKNRFVNGFSQILSIIETTAETEFINWWQNLSEILGVTSLSYNFNDLLKEVLIKAEKIVPNLWQNDYGDELSQFFYDLLKLKVDLILKDTTEFPSILKNLVAGARVYDSKTDSDVIICKPEDTILLKFDLIIISDFSEGNWPSNAHISPWLNKQMHDELKFYSNQIKLSSSLYYFYLLLHNSKVVITRSKKQLGNISLLPSSYMMKLKHLCPDTIISPHTDQLPSNLNTSLLVQSKNLINDNLIYSSVFPSQLSVTDVETLVRNPYNFYAKKILGLKKYENVASTPKLSEFGSFVHNVIELYTNRYRADSKDKVRDLLEISNILLSSIMLPLHTKEIWKIKLEAIAEEFIKFDEERRADGITTYSEIKGSISLQLSAQKIKITAIADRIEVDQNGIATILDYKTGTLPTNKDILSGFSPQLILEAIILSEGGFNIKVREVEKLVYIKIASSKPYIQIKEILLNRLELGKHKEGVIGLLEYYASTKVFSKEINFLKYNDYSHLARITPSHNL